MALSERQKKRLLRLAKLADEGELGIAELFDELFERLDEATGHLIGPKGDSPTDKELLALIKPLIPKPMKGEDGHTPTKEEILALIRPLIPVAKDGETPSDERLLALIIPLIPAPVPGEKGDKPDHKWRGTKLAFEKPDGSWGEEVDLKGQRGNSYAIFGGGSSGGGRVVKSYDIFSQLNGVLKTFTLPAFYRVISVHASSSPYSFRETVDYTTDANAMTITFTSEIEASTTLATGQTITIIYSEI